jgi:hypothetical protein
MSLHLMTPAARRVVPDAVFDAFGWCKSDELEWRRPADRWDVASPINGRDPARMVFVLRDGASANVALPTELANLHVAGLGLTGERALAPWAIDDATDGLYEARVRPRDAMWLAADNLNALFWGLHDWAHFHNHGPFVQRAWTELQCDATALAWLWLNREGAEIEASTWEQLRREALALSRQRFQDEGVAWDERLLDADRVRSIIELPAPHPLETRITRS